MQSKPARNEPEKNHRSDAIRSRINRAMLVPFFVLAPVTLATVLSAPSVNAPGPLQVAPNHANLLGRVDPNVAPWWELTVLPRVGETLAKRIVAFRDEKKTANALPFATAADLDDVHGIGPKTVARCRDLIDLPASRTTQR